MITTLDASIYMVSYIFPRNFSNEIKKGDIRYGIVHPTDETTKRLFKDFGKVLIFDVIYGYVIGGKAIQANPKDVTPIDVEINGPCDKFVDDDYDKEMKKQKGLGAGVVVGKVFKIGVADGYAYYIVTKVNKKTCHVEWRGWNLDHYTDHYFRDGGTFPIKKVERYVR